MDRRLGADLAGQAVKLAEAPRARRTGRAPPPRKAGAKRAPAQWRDATNGGSSKATASGHRPIRPCWCWAATGFIGRALVQKLRGRGLGVRPLVRDPAGRRGAGASWAPAGQGDFDDTPSIEAALSGIEHVYHLARGYGETWDDYLRRDVEPTRRLAELCLKRG